MSIHGGYGNHQFVPFSPPKPHKLPHSNKPLLHLLKLGPSHLSPSISPQNLNRERKFLVEAASGAASAPLGGSGAEYSEQLLGAKPKQKTKGIAGIDQDEIEDPASIADDDSCFCEFNGVQLHHKISDADLPHLEDGSTSQSPDHTKSSNNFPMILLHGFGASVFSWNRVMKPLAQLIRSKVVAFDRPAFGLTSRINAIIPKSLNPYSQMFSALATLFFIDFLAAEKAILVGHSAGALVAVDAYFEAPERVAALIFVAPAIFAPLRGSKNQNPENKSDSNTKGNLFSKIGSVLSYISGAILRMVKGMSEMINFLYKKALSAFLRSTIGVMLIRMIIDKFGVPAVRSAWYDPNQVSDHVVQGYTKPLKVKGWDKALVEYTVAMLADSASQPKPPMAKRLSEISCPVLIVTGDTDRIVPCWNSERLSRVIPGSSLEIIKNCGHLPQEEKAEEFVSIVEKFLGRVFGAAEEPQLQPVT